jgi:aminoglycoside 3-N-acetyltransferase
LLVHSSLQRLLRQGSKMFDFRITPETVYKSLLHCLGNEGTLLLPLFNFDFPTTKHFDIRNTKSQMGVLTELGRLDPHAVRTGHPIYSFAVMGKQAERFRNVDNYSGYGEDSPFGMLRALGGKIAVIELTDQNSMTSYHYVEEQNQVDYRYLKEFEGTCIGWDGQEYTRKYALFVRKLERGVKTDVNRMMDHLWDMGLYKGFKPGTGLGMRTIAMEDLYRETEKMIKAGKAKEYLYSIEENQA